MTHELEAEQELLERKEKIEKENQQLKKEMLFQLKQSMARSFTALLETSGIEEAQYLVEFQKIKEVSTGYLKRGFYFDIQSVDKGIGYTIKPSQLIERLHMDRYGKRVLSQEYPILEKLDGELQLYLESLRDIIEGGRVLELTVHFSQTLNALKASPLTLDLVHNTQIFMTPEEFEVWLALKEQYDLKNCVEILQKEEKITNHKI